MPGDQESGTSYRPDRLVPHHLGNTPAEVTPHHQAIHKKTDEIDTLRALLDDLGKPAGGLKTDNGDAEALQADLEQAQKERAAAMKEAYEARWETLDQAEDLDSYLRRYLRNRSIARYREELAGARGGKLKDTIIEERIASLIAADEKDKDFVNKQLEARKKQNEGQIRQQISQEPTERLRSELRALRVEEEFAIARSRPDYNPQNEDEIRRQIQSLMASELANSPRESLIDSIVTRRAAIQNAEFIVSVIGSYKTEAERRAIVARDAQKGGDILREMALKEHFLAEQRKVYDQQIRKEVGRVDEDTLVEQEVQRRADEKMAYYEDKNLSIMAIEEFRQFAREAQDLRRVFKLATEPTERRNAYLLFREKRAKMQEYLDLGPVFERAYREYLREHNNYINFMVALESNTKLQKLLREPAFRSIGPDAPLSVNAYARLEQVMSTSRTPQYQPLGEDEAAILEDLKVIYGEGSIEYDIARAELLGAKDEQGIQTKADIEAKLKEAQEKAAELWQNPMVRRFWQEHELDGLMRQYHGGASVLEYQDVIIALNQLLEWEEQHQDTTVGGALVGPPGVGKTTLVRHHIESRKHPDGTPRQWVYIDLSEDVTRYMLFGSKAIEFKSPIEHYEALATRLEALDEHGLDLFLKEQKNRLTSLFAMPDESGQSLDSDFMDNGRTLSTTVGMIDEQIAAAAGTPAEERLKKAKDHLVGLAQMKYRDELGNQFAHIIQKNGWRDGVIIHALKNNYSIIFDEFHRYKNWSLVHGLITSKPGTQWFFADNNEWITIPKDWKMYFTANIGRKHGGFVVPEALASRLGGQVMEVAEPNSRDEMRTALIACSDPEGNFKRSKEDFARMGFLVYEVFPKIRKFIEDKQRIIPISYRTIEQIAEKLVIQRHPTNGQPIFRATESSLDKAIYQVLVESYAVYEDRTIPEQIVQLLTQGGLLLNDETIAADVSRWIGKDEYARRKKAFAGMEDDFEEYGRRLRDQDVLHANVQATILPLQRK